MQGGGHSKTHVGFRDEWQNHKNLSQIIRRSNRKDKPPNAACDGPEQVAHCYILSPQAESLISDRLIMDYGSY